MVGVPPFESDLKAQVTPKQKQGQKKVKAKQGVKTLTKKERILKEKIKLPSYLTAGCHSLLKSLLNRDKANRLGSGPTAASEIKRHQFFKGLKWDKLTNLEIEPPLKPNKGTEDETEPVNFDEFYTKEAAVDSPTQGISPCETFHGFTYIGVDHIALGMAEMFEGGIEGGIEGGGGELVGQEAALENKGQSVSPAVVSPLGGVNGLEAWAKEGDDSVMDPAVEEGVYGGEEESWETLLSSSKEEEKMPISNSGGQEVKMEAGVEVREEVKEEVREEVREEPKAVSPSVLNPNAKSFTFKVGAAAFVPGKGFAP